MGDAFLTRRGSKEQKITFNDTPMVLTKTLPNALSVGRQKMAVASDEEYIAFLCGQNSSGNAVSNIDIFSRSGQHYVAYWPDEWTDMAAVITNNWLIGICGRGNDSTGTKIVRKWRMYDAIRNQGQPITMTTITNYSPLYGACAACFDEGIAVFGGLIANAGAYGAYNDIRIYSCWNQNNVNNNAGFQNVLRVTHERGFATMGKVASDCVMACGGVNLFTNVLYADTDIVAKDVHGNVGLTRGADLTLAQHHPTQANIYSQGRTYLLVGLGLTLAETEGIMLTPEQVVPTIDVYACATDSTDQTYPTKYGTLTLPLESNPLSAVALGFGDCVLYIVSYMQRVTKGYLVQLNPVRITTIEFNFRSYGLQGGVIGNDVGYLAGGIKNGEFSRDVLMIQLLRNVPIYPGMKYKIGDMTTEETASSFTLHPLQNATKLSGYMKF